ncbi:MAG: SDR family NAD(P)-dependent oxidoreductase, partial [Phycisphaerae bacterium]|nr:SDR family NAD(P)-dependent oxidoreductase [Phycisphaerae bacterium]
WNLDAPSAAEATTPAIEAALTSGCLSTVYLAQSLSRRENADLPRLWLVTRGAQSVESQTESVAVVQAPALGIGRVVVNEYPQLRTMQVDLSPTAPDVELDALVAELGADDREDEIALRGEGRYVHRFVACTLDTIGTAAERTAPVPCRLEISKFGVLDQLAFREMTRRAPGADEVEIQVCAAGLNFADVMKGLGLYPGLPDGPVPLGIECSGVITAVGSDVDEFSVGDEVMAIASFSFGTHVTTPAHLVARKPAHIGLEEAATVPVAFLTAYYALEYLGRLRAGERVLIHAATGGVGLAAIQIAQRAGAEIFATAGTPEKRHFLHSLGIDHVYDSRSLAFADEIMRDTGGEGVDIVLNSLAGEAIGKSLGLLRDYGRFLEIGKRDIYANSRIGLRPFRKNVSFFAIDLDRGMRERPDLFASLYREIVQCMCERTLGAIPYRLFGASRVVSAFRHMSQAKHIGKVVIGLQDPNIRAVPARHDRITLRADATYLITGGLGGIGLLVAEWMIERGARHLVLVGRRGIHSAECQEAIDAMRAAGAEVVVAQADVAREADVARVIADIARTLPPLRGVVHAAMVLEDCLLFNLDAERLFKVTAPKINGAWNLHTQTLDLPLDFFMLFSSMSSMFGISGQANYGAANAFLDALAHERRSRGLPALTINWGSVGGVGYVARHKEIVERFDRDGVQSLPPDDALNLMERLLEQEAVQVGVMRLDWRNWRGFTQTDAVSPRFLALVRAAATHASASAGDEGLSTRKALLAAPPEQRMERMQEILRTQVARVLGASAEHLDINKPLTELGLDSLMGVELRNWIEGELRLSLPTVELMRGPSVVRLATVLL